MKRRAKYGKGRYRAMKWKERANKSGKRKVVEKRRKSKMKKGIVMFTQRAVKMCSKNVRWETKEKSLG